ncbi:MAG: RecQ family ATP-dependent DNA helicase [Treponema sp.]|jgi:ATP-dependent DNA helicase RecQ|nr:RecQ family ATP-dependent DNA helicase [Treponema sp.]
MINNTFHEFSIPQPRDETPDPLSAAVKSLFGLSYLFPYQRLVMTNILEAAQAAGIRLNWPEETAQHEETPPEKNAEEYLSDRELSGRQIVILPTGAGKSLCFQLPAMLMEGLTLVIYPILSLMADQERRLNERRFDPVIIRGGQGKEERDEIWRKLESGQSKFIIANPEVLLTAQVKARLEKIKVIHAVIDEAHCVSEWGESFRPDYLEIGAIVKSLNPPLVTAFTATASAPVLEKIRKYVFGDLEARQIVGNPDRPNICYSAKGCISRDLAVRDLLVKNKRPAIVFCSSRPGTEKLSRYLRNEFACMGFNWSGEVRFYHAGLSREEKTNTEKWFINNREAVLCATCAYGMGVDKADVRTVIHRDCAPSVEAYLQESGRAGRDGEQSQAILLWGPDDERTLKRAKTEADRTRVLALLRYARDIERCRRHSLIKMLDYNADGEVPEKNCCDVCENTAGGELREASSIWNFFKKCKRRFTPEEAASVLAASETVRWSEEDAALVISHLIKTGRLKKFKHFPWKNRITTQKK